MKTTPKHTPSRKNGASRGTRTTGAFARAVATAAAGRQVLRLYVAGATDRSRRAILRTRQFCEAELKGRYDLQVIDIYQQPALARDGQIIATPTLVRDFPRPVRRLIGNFTSAASLLAGLDPSQHRGKAAS